MARISGLLKRLFRRPSGHTAEAPANEASPRKTTPRAAHTARPTQRQTDVPLDAIGNAYIPPVTSSKASFRSDGSDHQRDQELRTIADDRWNDEDRFTNKSGDPRIGTHRRSYEPAERRGETRE